MNNFSFEGPAGVWRFAVRNHDWGTDSSVWHVRAAHIPFKDQIPESLDGYGIFEGYFEVDGDLAPSTLTLVARATKLVEDELEEALNDR